MDLFSASLRYAKPFRFGTSDPEPELPIASRGLIGDGHTAALVRPDGIIDWLCFPRFDSPSVFGGILDPKHGGITGIRPEAPRFDSLQAYDPDTNVLETLLMVPNEGVIRLTDFMPWNDDPRACIHEVHRRVECRDGSVALNIIFDPRFGYGASETTVERREHGVIARSGAESIVIVVGHNVAWHDRPGGGVQATVHLRKGEHCWVILSWDAPDPEPLTAYRPFEQLRATRHHWRHWASQLEYDGPNRHHVMRSALALKLMIYGPTGAMVAAPTAALPEWLGGERNWDYRFTWSRDTAMGIRAANRIGYSREAREFFHFMRDALQANPELQVMYAVTGDPVPEERELSHLRGYADSRPVRIGNGAKDQLQLDTAGALIDAAFLHEQNGGAIGLRTWRHLRHVVSSVAKNWHRPDHGI
ncbi:MAG: glycoside hydrolase family 15 protein, partial [Myxococcales bacterium]|nr:glycoside hydrolase family 15 protein [Myxococcales bacterium]